MFCTFSRGKNGRFVRKQYAIRAKNLLHDHDDDSLDFEELIDFLEEDEPTQTPTLSTGEFCAIFDLLFTKCKH